MNPIHRLGQKAAVLAIGATVVVSSLAIVAPVMAAGPYTLSVSPATTNTTPGTSFSVDVVGASGTDTISGVTASLTWGAGLTLTGITKGADWVAAGAGTLGFPSVANTATFIASANAANKIPAVGFSFIDGASNLAGTHTVFTATFTAGTCGAAVTFNLPIGAVDGHMLDGAAATYGADIVPTATGGTVNNPCATPAPTPAITPVPTPTPTLAPANGNTTVTGTVDQGFLALSCPQNLSLPLVRNATNIRDFVCTVYSNTTWNLNVQDQSVTHKGHLVSGVNVLTSSLHVVNLTTVPSNDIDLATGGNVASGSNSVNQALELQQFVNPVDLAGNYGITLTFQALSTF